ncbi:family 16 glycosylhydrolase [Fibrobacter sp. UWEL]|uniref:family 16 glycosylhydrolase n=1 Tax=Fibrobacter sp. UWEL TaxID=1896209 RepID=UPI000916CDB2|nr:family 16 glycosylhydrolase [Fibrobacter sp. UWEL]SHL12380.1 Glycosyl hydrolases family 16 [Fibrobacter sp. UWEL]
MDLKKTLAFLAVATVSVMAQNKAYSGAELYSNEEWMYGKYEARMMMGATSGTVSSMFLYANGSEIKDGRPWVEVDIEVLGKNPGSFQSNIITGTATQQITSEKHHTVSPAATAAFHTYGLEWTPNYVRWTLDGVEVRKTEGGQVSNLTKAQGLRFNLWSSESVDWVGAFDDNKLPIFQFINWVKRYKYTPGQGPDGSDFTLDWTDDFDTFNSQRWSKGDWTFDGNRVDLTDKNIYSKEGMLILALTKKGQEMFNGQVPKDNEPSPVASSSSQAQPKSSSSAQQVKSSSSQAQNPWQQPVSSSSVANPWQQPVSSSATVNPWQPQVSSSSQQQVIPDGIKNLKEVHMNKKSRGTFNAKGERVNKAGAARYRVDFDL